MLNIKGVKYKLEEVEEYLVLNDEVCEAVTNFDTKIITLSKQIDKKYKNKVLRHELIHAFLVESGLPSYSNDEVLVEWIARNIPLINLAEKEVTEDE